MNARHGVAVFGGTFDPIHYGHLRSALELRERLGLDEVRLVPARQPPLRGQPGASAEQRLAMVELAVADEPGLQVDARELTREGPSYTVDTLEQLRTELGPETALCFVLGIDAFARLDQWQRWSRILEVAHLVVLERPGARVPEYGAVAELWQRRGGLEQLRAAPAGGVLAISLTQLDISATAVRDCIRAGNSPRYLIPDVVWHYIHQHGLYGCRRR